MNRRTFLKSVTAVCAVGSRAPALVAGEASLAVNSWCLGMTTFF